MHGAPPYVTTLISTKSAFMRLRFLELRDWSGEVRISGLADEPARPLVVSVASDQGSGPPLDLRVEESADGVEWKPSGRAMVRAEFAVSSANSPDRRRGARPPAGREEV